MDDSQIVQTRPPRPAGTPPSVGRDSAVGEGSMSLRARPLAENVDELQIRCGRIYGPLRDLLITRQECDQAITVLEHRYGLR